MSGSFEKGSVIKNALLNSELKIIASSGQKNKIGEIVYFVEEKSADGSVEYKSIAESLLEQLNLQANLVFKRKYIYNINIDSKDRLLLDSIGTVIYESSYDDSLYGVVSELQPEEIEKIGFIKKFEFDGKTKQKKAI